MAVSPRNDPPAVSSGEIPAIDPHRAADVEQKHREIADFLASHHYDALLIQKPLNYAWFTCGGDNSRAGSSETVASLFITPEARVVVTNNVDSAKIFDCDLPGLGFQLKQRPWHEPRTGMVEDLCRGRMVASDTGFGRTHDVSPQLAMRRLPLTEYECDRLRELGGDVAHAVEATARHCRRGQTEAEIAGEVAHRLIKRQVIPERIQVAADGRSQRYRNWSYGADPLQRYCHVAAVGRRHGLHVAAARTVSFGEPPELLRTSHYRALLVHATGMYFSQSGWELFEVWKRIARIYEKFGSADEWQHAAQAEIAGYAVCEAALSPRSEFHLSERMALHWHPSVGPALAGDTILVGDGGTELLTPTQQWPRVRVEVKGAAVSCPDILQRAADESEEVGRALARTAGDSVLRVHFEDTALDDDERRESAVG